MKNIFLILTAAVILSACTRKPQEADVVCKTYVHSYGVPLDEQDWEARGQDGQVTYILKDGVTVSQNYHKGILDGEASYTFPHTDFIQKREKYANGVLTEECWNGPNGIPQEQVIHQGSNKKTIVNWYDNGAPQCKEEYENNLLIKGDYYSTANQVESQIVDQNGIRIRRNATGELIAVDEVQNGIITQSTTYHINGTPESVTPYVNNQPEGLRRTFLNDGQPNTLEEWTNGQQHGTTTNFLNGERYSESIYVNGTKNGIEKCYRNDQVAQETTWVNGQKHGPCHSYVGGNTKTTWYCRDQLVNRATYETHKNQY